MAWLAEDAGPRRQQWSASAQLGVGTGESMQATHRSMMVLTMVVSPSPDEVFALCHTGGDDAESWVERLHPTTLETIAASERLRGGPAWPGGIAVHDSGDLHVVFGNHAHRLTRDLQR
ncbi:MAG: hypothetical protein FJW13_04645, partial [Actinobacteria bacterium]|nr:hypothetical protein [Actinomycetota bacterium]